VTSRRVTPARPRFFPKPSDFRAWLDANHAIVGELLVGFHKKGSGKPSITWPESVDEALCVGWIDGIRRRVDETSYTIRFTPRRKGSIWSAINIGRVNVLTTERRMRPAGLAAFKKRTENKSGIYAYEQRPQELIEPYRSQFKKHRAAWAFFEAQPPGYHKRITWFIVSAKQEATRQARLARAIDASAKKIRL
jgi:uncharacterized protein YdeI (YjbR/CyaY-like superfamily)